MDQIQAFIAPVLLGGDGTPPLWPGHGARTMAQALRLTRIVNGDYTEE